MNKTLPSYRNQGLDTPSPFLQLSGTFFKGQHDSLLGTEIMFTEAKGTWTSNHPTHVTAGICVLFVDDQDRSKKCVAPLATTERRIRFREVQLVPKKPSSDGTALHTDQGAREMLEDQVTEATPPTSRDSHGLERMTSVTGPTLRRTRAAKGGTPKVKKHKASNSKEAPPSQESENEGTSTQHIEAMEVDG